MPALIAYKWFYVEVNFQMFFQILLIGELLLTNSVETRVEDRVPQITMNYMEQYENVLSNAKVSNDLLADEFFFALMSLRRFTRFIQAGTVTVVSNHVPTMLESASASIIHKM